MITWRKLEGTMAERWLRFYRPWLWTLSSSKIFSIVSPKLLRLAKFYSPLWQLGVDKTSWQNISSKPADITATLSFSVDFFLACLQYNCQIVDKEHWFCFSIIYHHHYHLFQPKTPNNLVSPISLSLSSSLLTKTIPHAFNSS